MPEPADQPAKRERSLAGFYIAMGVAAALVGLGAWLYGPLRTSYAIYRLDRSPAAGGSGTPLPDASWHREFDVCVKAARGGHEPAMAAVFRQAQRSPYFLSDAGMTDALGAVAKSQPDLFYRLLAAKPPSFILSVLKALDVCCDVSEQLARGPIVTIFRTDIPRLLSSEEATFKRDIRDIVRHLNKYERSPSSEARSLAQGALEFARRNFAGELAEAEKAKAEEPKP